MPEPEGPEHASVYVVTAAGLEAVREGTVAVAASWRRLPGTGSAERRFDELPVGKLAR